MPNRIIKESTCTSETLAAVSADAERLFWRLIVQADDYGCYDGRPQTILGKCLTAFVSRYTTADVEQWLQELEEAGLIRRYAVDGRKYLHIRTWSVHQRPPRAAKPRYPLPPDDGSTAHDDACCQMTADDGDCEQVTANAPVSVSVFDIPPLTPPKGDAPAQAPDAGSVDPSEPKRRGRKRDKPADPRVKPVIDAYYERFRREFGRPPVIQGKRDGEHIRKLPAEYDVPTLLDLMDRWFRARAEPWTWRNGDIPSFCAAIPRLVSMRQRASPVLPDPQDDELQRVARELRQLEEQFRSGGGGAATGP